MFKKLAIAALFLSKAVFGDDEEKSDVVTLTEENFDSVVGSSERILVEFYAPWCGHCKSLAPHYEKAATQLKEAGSVTILAKVDATEEKDLATKYGVRGFPTLKYFTGGDAEAAQDYGGGRTADTIVSWLQKRELPALTELENKDALVEFAKKHDVVVVATTTDEEKLKLLAQFADASRDDFVSAVLKTDGDTFAVHRQFEGEEAIVTMDISKDWNIDSLTQFVNNARFPLFGEITQQNFAGYMSRGIPIAWVALDPKDEESFGKIKAAIMDSGAAASVAGDISVTWIDNNKYVRHVDSIGITSVPGMIVLHDNDKWRFEGDVSDASVVTDFFKKWKAGEVEKWLKTEEVPEDPLDEGVYVLVGSTFDEIVNSDKDVFVEFYAPWCTHCKKLAPEYVKVAEAFKDVDDVVIAKIDATANDTPEPIQGFPTLFFYPKGKGVGEGEKFQGGRTAKDIVDWIEENASGDVAAVNKEEL